MFPFESNKKPTTPDVSILKKLRKELVVRLPISGYTVTVYEPLVASVHQLRNKYFGILQQIFAEYNQSLQKATDPQMRRQIEMEIYSRYEKELQIFVFDALYQYVSENIESPVPVDELAASEVTVYIPTLLELLAHGWVIRDVKVVCPAKITVTQNGKITETTCNYESTTNLVFNPIYFAKPVEQITEQDEAQFIENVVRLHKLKTTLLTRLTFQVPEKPLTPITVLSIVDVGDTTVEIEVQLGYAPYREVKRRLERIRAGNEIPDIPVMQYIPNMRRLTLRVIDKIQNQVLDEKSYDTTEQITGVLLQLPESILHILETDIKEQMPDEPDIRVMFEYTCPSCGNTSTIYYDPVAYFLASIMQEVYTAT